MHDATWRNKFGGSIYKTGGSHGCINLPSSVAKKIYETIDKGYAVLVYRMPGDNPTVVQQTQTQADVPSVINAISIIGPVTLESETAIMNARNMYNALSDTDKAQVSNYDTLTAAEAALSALKGQQQTDQSQQQNQGQQQTDQSQQQTDQSQQQTDQSQPQDQGQQQTDQSQQQDQGQPQDQGQQQG